MPTYILLADGGVITSDEYTELTAVVGDYNRLVKRLNSEDYTGEAEYSKLVRQLAPLAQRYWELKELTQSRAKAITKQ